MESVAATGSRGFGVGTAVRRDLTIGALAERAGVHIETIRYYERIGVLPAPHRTEGGHRLYGREHLERLTFIRRGRELGFSLGEMRTLLGLMDGGHTCGEVRAVVLDHLGRIRAKIADLRRMERTLAGTAARCDGGNTPECPIVDVLSGGGGGEAANPGARRSGRARRR